MPRLVYQTMTTLNGRVDDPDAWVHVIGDDLYTEIDRVYATFDTVLVGRTTYEEMFAYWPGAEAEGDGSDITRRMAHKMNSYRKLVFSRAEEAEPLEWHNAERVVARCDEDIVRFVKNLKSQPGGDIHLAGGAQLSQTVIRLGLVDEYHFYVHPAVSPGATWSEKIEDTHELELISVTAYAGGVVGLYYRPKHA